MIPDQLNPPAPITLKPLPDKRQHPRAVRSPINKITHLDHHRPRLRHQRPDNPLELLRTPTHIPDDNHRHEPHLPGSRP